LIEAKLVKLGTGTLASHVFLIFKTKYQCNQEVIFWRYQSPARFPGWSWTGLKPCLRVTLTLKSFGQRPINELRFWSIEPDRNIPAKTGRLFAQFTGSRLFHRQSASLVGQRGKISGESRGSSGDWV